MKENKMTYRALIALVFVLMLAGCSDDIEQGEKRVLNLVPYVSSYSVSGQADNAKTRAVTIPEEYATFSAAYSTTAAEEGRIKVFLAHKDNSLQWVCKSGGDGEFTYKGNDTWQSSVFVENSTLYYIYGYMPAGSASATISSSDYSAGATLTLSGLNVLNPIDVCAIVGVKKSSDTGNLVAGQYGYLTGASGDDEELYLLLNHIYSKVDFRFAVDADYNELRTIKLNSVKMELPSVTSTMTATINLYKNSQQYMKCTYTDDGSSSAQNVTLLDAEKTLTTSYESVAGYFLPGKDEQSFTLTCKYDVLDEKGNCVRKDCESKNKITIKAPTAGNNYILKLLVQPTYLYQLSQPDLDNPVIKVES